MDNTRERSVWSDAVATQLRRERAGAGLTQKDVIELSGIPRSTYIRLEKGTRVADTTQLAHLCAVYKLTLSQFFQRVEWLLPDDGGPADELEEAARRVVKEATQGNTEPKPPRTPRNKRAGTA